MKSCLNGNYALQYALQKQAMTIIKINDEMSIGFQGSFFVQKEPAIKVDINIGYTQEIYLLNGEVMAMFPTTGKGSKRSRKFTIEGHVVEVKINFNQKNLYAIAIVDGVIVKDPIFEEFTALEKHGVINKKNGYFFNKVKIFISLLIIYISYLLKWIKK